VVLSYDFLLSWFSFFLFTIHKISSSLNLHTKNPSVIFNKIKMKDSFIFNFLKYQIICSICILEIFNDFCFWKFKLLFYFVFWKYSINFQLAKFNYLSIFVFLYFYYFGKFQVFNFPKALIVYPFLKYQIICSPPKILVLC
jgi:hypothetical protein